MEHKVRREDKDCNMRQQRLLMEQVMEDDNENDEALLRRQMNKCIQQKQDKSILLQKIRLRFII